LKRRQESGGTWWVKSRERKVRIRQQHGGLILAEGQKRSGKSGVRRGGTEKSWLALVGCEKR